MELYHHGILGMHWGIRRYQNPDGTLTPAGRRRLEKKDVKWAARNTKRIQKKAMRDSRDELKAFVRDELNVAYEGRIRNADGSLSRGYINDYNRKLAELMNSHVGEIPSPSGRVVKFVAKRGSVGVYMALADVGYDMSQLRNGVWTSGKIAYKKQNVDMA